MLIIMMVYAEIFIIQKTVIQVKNVHSTAVYYREMQP